MVGACLLVALVFAACGSASRSPIAPSIPAMLDAWRAAGLTCSGPGYGMPPGNPQWGCQGVLHDSSLHVVFEADEAGLTNIVAQVPAATDLSTARAVFDDLVTATPAFSMAQGSLRTWIDAWDSSDDHASGAFSDVRIALGLDRTWITLYLVVARSSRAAPPASA
jgi:hypothetical protein